MGAPKLLSVPELIEKISATVESITGVQLGKRQETMVSTRLHRRASELGLRGLEEYAAYFEANEAAERPHLVSLLTTHHTYFFREFQHFEYLEKTLLPELLPELKARPDKTLRVWSAACSRGQEVYSLVMFLKSVLPRLDPELKFTVHGTDVDANSVQIAKNGVYLKSELDGAPLAYTAGYWAKGTGEIADYVKAKAPLREHCSFEAKNLLDAASSFPATKFDVIFCRNVFIYFTKEQVAETMRKFSRCLSDQGRVILGVSESITGMKLEFEPSGPSVYRKPGAKQAPATAPAQHAPRAEAPAKKLRVLTVDDSATVHTLLKQILAKDPAFEWVGSALNGREAAQKITELKPDLVTLDIHMPEMDGIAYLQSNYRGGHPPVVMVSSVSRDDSGLALKALQLGASDYVEKPALANLEERGEEIRVKLRTAFESAASRPQRDLKIESEFSKRASIRDPESAAVFLFGAMGNRKDLAYFFRNWDEDGPPVFLFVEGAGAAIDAIGKALEQESGRKMKIWASGAKAAKGDLFLCDRKGAFAELDKAYKRAAIGAFRSVSVAAVKQILGCGGRILFVEEGRHPLREAASDSTPATSFPYLCWKYLSEH